MGDNRESLRTEKELTVKLSELTYPVNKNQEKKVISRDLGTGGICLMTEESYKPGTVLSLKIEIGEFEGYKKPYSLILESSKKSHLAAVAEVIWCDQNAHGTGFKTGIKFVDIYEDDYTALLNYLGDS